MGRVRVKICGVTRVADAVAAAEAGADAVGLVFHAASPRNVDSAVARQIVTALGPFVTPVGLFVDQEPETVALKAAEVGLRAVQLQGREPPEFVAELGFLPVIKAVRVDDEMLGELERWRRALSRRPLDNLQAILLESATDQPGGSGVENDWAAVRRAMRRGAFAGLPPIIAAGGLAAGNVGRVVRMLRPWAVDVSSGVEISKGIKSPRKIRQFIAAVGVSFPLSQYPGRGRG